MSSSDDYEQLIQSYSEISVICLSSFRWTDELMRHTKWFLDYKNKVAFSRKLEIPILQHDPGLSVPNTPLPQGISFSSNQTEWFQQPHFSWTPDHMVSLPQILALSPSVSRREFYSPSITLDPQPPTMCWIVAKTSDVIASQLTIFPLLLNFNYVSKYVSPDVLCSPP